MFEKFFKEIIIKYKKIFKTNYDYEKLYFINTFPRSGTNFIRNIIGSEIEISNHYGNGIPKYLNELDSFIFNDNKNLFPTDLFNECYKNLSTKDYRFFYKDINLDNLFGNFIFSHHPLQINDLINDQENLKEVYLIRKPLPACLSYLKHTLNLDNYHNNKINYNKTEILKKLIIVCDNYKLFFSHLWKLRSNKKKLIINYEDLVSETFKSIEKIYSFFNYKFNSKNLRKAIKINSKDNTIKLIYKNIKVTNRVSNYHFDNNLEDEVTKKINEIMKKEIISYPNLFK